MVTVEPPVIKLLPLASLACTVNTCVLLPFAMILAVAGVNVDWVAFAVPALTVDDAVLLELMLLLQAPLANAVTVTVVEPLVIKFEVVKVPVPGLPAVNDIEAVLPVAALGLDKL